MICMIPPHRKGWETLGQTIDFCQESLSIYAEAVQQVSCEYVRLCEELRASLNAAHLCCI
jgi:hypothetical protein